MRKEFHINLKKATLVCHALALVLLVLSFFMNQRTDNIHRTVATVSRLLERRLSVLDRYMSRALEQDCSEWMELKGLPEDMVVYRYTNDSLQSWCHQFPLANDDIRPRRLGVEKIGSYLIKPAINEVGSRAKFVSIGPKWFAVKAVSDVNGCKVIGGLEILNTAIDGSGGEVNPRLYRGSNFTIAPLSFSGGDDVMLDGRPFFKLTVDNMALPPLFNNSLMRWIALLLILLGVSFALVRKKTVGMYVISLMVLLASMAVCMFWSSQMSDTPLFSASLYAGRWLFKSFGSMALVTLHLFAAVSFTYVMRRELHLRSAFIVIMTLVMTAYSLITLYSILINSSIGLELHRFNELSIYSLIVYLMIMLMMAAVVLLIQMFMESRESLAGRDVFNWHFRLAFSSAAAIVICGMIGLNVSKREVGYASIWAERLTVDRDLNLEIFLKEVETMISKDNSLPDMVVKRNADDLLQSRMMETYFLGMDMEYDISVSSCSQQNHSKLREYTRTIMHGTPLESLSRFVFLENEKGESSYAGMFSCLGTDNLIYRMLITLTPKSQREYLGYYSIFFQLGDRGHFSLPPLFSHARYKNGRLISYKGTFPYPTVLQQRSLAQLKFHDGRRVRQGHFVHFVNYTDENELVLISRPLGGFKGHLMSMGVMVALIYMSLLVEAGICLRKRRRGSRGYFMTRINSAMTVSLTLSMVLLTIFSISFVINRNENNLRTMMAGKINTIQALVESRCTDVDEAFQLNTREFTDALCAIAGNTKSDITLYTPSGRAFKSTAPEVFDRLLLGVHIDEDAYRKLRIENQRYFIEKEEYAGREYHNLYSPVFNGRGKMVAMLCSPYTAQDFNFSRDAVFHTSMTVIIFAIIMLLSVLITSGIVKRIFGPLVEISDQMVASDGHLEHIEYGGKDEITSLVEAYNRMVDDLGESTMKLAQAESDRTWSEMARVVAHDIKNPLTPMKLSLQRLIRLKQKNDPDWDQKFEESSRVMLENIEVLTETASEFLSHARLYTEVFDDIDIDLLLKDQVALFNTRDDIDFSYIGFEGAMVSGPKPQLTRAFNNLISNAFQAVEENAGEKVVKVSLRMASEEGFYDIVVEDNGPGVSEEHIGKLFTPNFTTKSSGSGLGLATSRITAEKSGGSISYSRSLLLKGACFTIKLPVKKLA
ncbi:MAG: hypothetical protein HUJ94_06240 [Bacteroidales bacterium]|nr:hypothetical protein [Bacteroidales bacterium]